MLEAAGVSVADFRRQIETADLADRRDGKFYRYTPEIKLAARVALAVGRPLLVFGPSGCGKSSLVFNLARVLRRRYYEFVVHSRSEARDLYYRFDAVRRLGEAQLGAAGQAEGHVDWRNCYPFIEPGPLWWVYSPQTARLRGSQHQSPRLRPAIDPGRWPDDYADPGARATPTESISIPPAVLLIDEIDKADPDFPNNLLVPLGSQQFVVEETGDLIKLGNDQNESGMPLVVITSNRERELPVAFVRRCVVLEIQPLENDQLVELAKLTFREDDGRTLETWQRVAELLKQIRGFEQVSAAEYLDTVKAIQLLHADESQWKDIILRTSWTSSMAGGD